MATFRRRISDLGEQIAEHRDTPLVYLGGNLGYFLALNEIVQHTLEVPEGMKTLSLMGAGLGLVPWNAYILKPLTGAVRAINRNGISRLASWGKTAVLGTMTALSAYLTVDAVVSQEKTAVEISEEGSGCEIKEKKPLEEIVNFADTGKKTTGGYHIFDYRGEATGAQAISNEFDLWDESRGDLCRNTGYDNVRDENGDKIIVANCINTPGEQPGPTRVAANYTKIDYSNARLQNRMKKGKFKKGFLEKVEQMCGRLDMNAMALLSVMDFETGGSFSPNQKNYAGSSGVGLIQFMDRTARELGTTTAELARMTQAEQLDYVQDYFELKRVHKPGANYAKAQDIALAVFYPKALNKPEGHKLFCNGSVSYRQNQGLDVNRNSCIEKREYAHQSLQRGYL